MKKKFIIIILFVLLLGGCNRIKEYKETPIDKLSFKTTDYMGGISTTHVFDFKKIRLINNYKTQLILVTNQKSNQKWLS